VAFGGYGGTVRLWRDGAIVRTLASPVEKEQIALDVAFSPDGTLVAMAGQALDGTAGSNAFVVIHDLAAGTHRFVPAAGAAAKLAFTPDARWLVMGGDNGWLRVHALRAGDRTPALAGAEGGGSVEKLAVADQGRRLFVAWSTGRIDVLDLASGTRVDSIPAARHGALRSMAVAADAQSLYAAYADGAVVRWRRLAATRWGARELYRHAADATGLALLDEGTRLVSVDRDGRLYVARDERAAAPARVRWAVSTRLDQAWIDSQARRVALLASGRLEWFDPDSGRIEAAPPRARSEAVRPPADFLARHGHLVLRRRGADVVVEGDPEKVLPVGGPADAATFSADGRKAYTLVKRRVQAWDLASGARAGAPADVDERAAALAASPDGRWLAVLHAAPLEILQLERGARGAALTLLELPALQMRVRQGPVSGGSAIIPVTPIFAHGGQRLYLVNQGPPPTVDIWDLRALRHLDDTWQGDDGTIVLGLMGGNEPLWLADRTHGRLFTLDLRPDTLAAWACALAGRAITSDEWARLVGVNRPYAPRCVAPAGAAE
jgi:WD40 repeat protein